MSTCYFDHDSADDKPTLVDPGTRLAEILDALAARMTPEQRGAFLSHMAAMDRHGSLSAATVTLGRA